MSNLFTLLEQKSDTNTLNFTNLHSNIPYEPFYTSQFGIDVRNILISNDNTTAAVISVFDGIITIVDLNNLEKKMVITSFNRPFEGVISSDNQYLYVLCRLDTNVYKVPIAGQNEPIISVELTSFDDRYYPLSIATDLNHTKIYCAGNTNTIDVVTTSTFTVDNTINLGLTPSNYVVADFELSSNGSLLVFANSKAQNILAISLDDYSIKTVDLKQSFPNLKIVDCVIDSTENHIYALGLSLRDSILIKLTLSESNITIDTSLSFTNTRTTKLYIDSNDSKLYLLNTKGKVLEKVDIPLFQVEYSFNTPVYPYYFTHSDTDGYLINKNSGEIINLNTSTNTIADLSEGLKQISYLASSSITYNYDFTINKIHSEFNKRGPIVVKPKKTNSPIVFNLNKKRDELMLSNITFIDSIGNTTIPNSIFLYSQSSGVIESFNALDNGTLSIALPFSYKKYLLKATLGDSVGTLSFDPTEPSISDVVVSLSSTYESTVASSDGYVESSSLPLQDANIQFFLSTTSGYSFEGFTRTDNTGYYSMTDLPSGTYKIIATKNGYEEQFFNITLTNGTSTSQNFSLAIDANSTKTLSGNAYLSNDTIAETAIIKLMYFENNDLKIIQDIQTTDSTGYFEFSSIPNDKYYYLEGDYWY